MSFKIEKRENFTLVILPEKLDLNVSTSLKEECIIIHNIGAENLIFDLSATRYADSSGIYAMVQIQKLFSNTNGICVIIGFQEQIKKLFLLSGLDKKFKFSDNLEKAVDLIQDFIIEKYDAD